MSSQTIIELKYPEPVDHVGARSPITFEPLGGGAYRALLQGYQTLGLVLDGLPDGFEPPLFHAEPHAWSQSEGGGFVVESLQVQPFPRLDCGCIVNLGGYRIRSCQDHWNADDARLENARCDHGAPLGRCRRCDIEAERLGKDDRRMIDEATH